MIGNLLKKLKYLVFTTDLSTFVKRKAHEELEVVKRERDWEKVKNVNLTREIEGYNKSRHWWERKLKIKE